MRNELKKVLNTLNDADFRELQWAIALADHCRNLLKKHNLTTKQLAEKMHIKPAKLILMVKGNYPFDVRSIALIDSIRSTLEIEMAGKKMESIISFPEYKYSKPISEKNKEEIKK